MAKYPFALQPFKNQKTFGVLLFLVSHYQSHELWTATFLFPIIEKMLNSNENKNRFSIESSRKTSFFQSMKNYFLLLRDGARNFCRSQGGDLAIIQTASENAKAFEAIQAGPRSSGVVWIGYGHFFDIP